MQFSDKGCWANGVHRQNDGTLFHAIVIQVTPGNEPTAWQRFLMALQGWHWISPTPGPTASFKV